MIVPEDHGEMSYSWGISEEQVGGVNELPGVVGAITPLTPDSDGEISEGVVETPDIKGEVRQLVDEETVIEEKEAALEAVKEAQEKTWEVKSKDITGDHVNKEQDVFIVFE